MLTTEEAARRLGVKVPTLYAYVSRGLLESHRDPTRRGSLFDLADVEALAARSRGGRQTATRLATITTGVTQLDQELGPIYRGRLATELAAGVDFRGGGRAPLAVGGAATGPPDLGPCPLAAHARPHALGPGRVRRHRPAALRPAAGRRGPRRPPLRRRAHRGRRGRRRPARTPAPPSRRGSPPASPTSTAGGAARRRQRRPRPLGRPRAGHLDHGRARRGLGARRPLRRLAGGAGHAGRPAARRRQPAGLRAAGRGRARRRGARPQRQRCASRDGCPASATPSTRAATRALVRCWRWPSRCSATSGAPSCARSMALAARARRPAGQLRPRPGRVELGHGHAPDTGRTIFAVARVAGWAAHYMEELTERPLRFRARAVYSV